MDEGGDGKKVEEAVQIDDEEEKEEDQAEELLPVEGVEGGDDPVEEEKIEDAPEVQVEPKVEAEPEVKAEPEEV